MKAILLIEDNTDILANLKRYPEIEDYTMLAAKSGKLGIEFSREFISDLIVCNVLTLQLDGREVLCVPKETFAVSEIPFLFSSSLSEIFNKTPAFIITPLPQYFLRRSWEMFYTWITCKNKISLL